MKVTERNSIKEKIRNDDKYAIGALMLLYDKQTKDEKLVQGTTHQNDVGFNAVDTGFLTSLAKNYERMGFLTSKQIFFAKKALLKYCSQIERLGGIKPMPIKEISKTPKEKQEYIAKIIGAQEKAIKITFPFDRNIINQIKSQIIGRKFNPENKSWEASLLERNVKKLHELGFKLDPQLKKWWVNFNTKKATKIPKNILNGFYKFQKEGVRFIESKNGRALIADEMGLGKTIQALGWLKLHPELKPVIITCPASIKINWSRETKKWLPEAKIQILNGKAKTPITGNTIIVNYDILANKTKEIKEKNGRIKTIEIPNTGWVDRLKKLKPKVIITDECHYYKNQKAARTKAIKKLTQDVPHVIALSGTPIINRPVEFFNAINIINKQLFPSFWLFAQKYCGAKYNKFGWDFTGNSNITELNEILTTEIMIRRKKEDVLKELPEKQRSVIPLKLDNKKEYDDAEQDFDQWLIDNDANKKDNQSQAIQLQKIEALKQLAVKGKIKQCTQWIENFLESEEKLIVFCAHHKPIDTLMTYFKTKAVKLDGRDSAIKKQKSVDEFQTNKNIKLFVGNIKAAGIGIALTAASNLAFIELGWSPGEHDQAEDRPHRIGQKKAVNIYYLIGQGSIEEDIAKLLDEKRQVLTQILDGQRAEDQSLLLQLLNKIKQRRQK